MDSSSVIDSSSSTTSTRTGLPSGLSSSVRPWGEVVVMVHTMSGASENTLAETCDFPEKRTGVSQGTPGWPLEVPGDVGELDLPFATGTDQVASHSRR